jgi:putative spermidine/putrescine transport system permease protein
MKQRSWPWIALTVAVGAIYMFIVGPILITTAVSFNATNRSFFPPQGFSLRWWSDVLQPQWVQPMLFSLELAAVTCVLATAFGLPLAFALHRYSFPGKGVIRAIIMGPLILPTLVTGIALLQFLTIVGLGDWIGYGALLIGHVVICLPFSVRTVAISLHTIPPNVEAAAGSLGARPWSVLRHVTLPLLIPGIFAGMAFAFIHSFTDVNLSLFIARPGARPITVTILSFLDTASHPHSPRCRSSRC